MMADFLSQFIDALDQSKGFDDRVNELNQRLNKNVIDIRDPSAAMGFMKAEDASPTAQKQKWLAISSNTFGPLYDEFQNGVAMGLEDTLNSMKDIGQAGKMHQRRRIGDDIWQQIGEHLGMDKKDLELIRMGKQ